MFDLEQSIADWRRQMLAAGIKTPAPLEELEIHLREEIERQIKAGAIEPQAFEAATERMGQAGPIKIEFKKINAETWNRPMAWTAWTLFAVSFFLPAYADGPGWHSTGMLGWQCAAMSASAVSSSDFWNGKWFTIHLGFLTLANLFMIVSPFVFFRFSQSARLIKWARWFGLAALTLVWSFLLIMLLPDDRNKLEVGCYIWASSFLLLYLSALKFHSRKAVAAKYV